MFACLRSGCMAGALGAGPPFMAGYVCGSRSRRQRVQQRTGWLLLVCGLVQQTVSLFFSPPTNSVDLWAASWVLNACN
jgi:predicted acyltransferase